MPLCRAGEPSCAWHGVRGQRGRPAPGLASAGPGGCCCMGSRGSSACPYPRPARTPVPCAAGSRPGSPPCPCTGVQKSSQEGLCGRWDRPQLSPRLADPPQTLSRSEGSGDRDSRSPRGHSPVTAHQADAPRVAGRPLRGDPAGLQLPGWGLGHTLAHVGSQPVQPRRGVAVEWCCGCQGCSCRPRLTLGRALGCTQEVVQAGVTGEGAGPRHAGIRRAHRCTHHRSR